MPRKVSSSEKNLSDKPIHMIMLGNDKLLFATCNAATVEKTLAANPATKAFFDVDPLVVAQFAEARIPYRLVIGDNAWQKLAPAIQQFSDHLAVYATGKERPTYQVIPPDIPMKAAIGRGDIIERFPQIADIPTMIEISEIVQANKFRRPIDKSLFREESLKSTWASLSDLDEKVLQSSFHSLNDQMRKTPNMAPLDFALQLQELTEIKMAIAEHELAAEESLSPGVA